MRNFLLNDINSNIKEIEIDKIIPFADNPFKEYSEEKLDELVESISQNGLINPIILWQKEDEFILLSGHNRVNAFKKLKYTHLTKEMFKIYNDISEEEAELIVVESNLMQRQVILPSEKAFAYKMKLEAIKKSAGRPSKENGRQIVAHLKSANIIGNDSNESGRKVQRYIRLTNLIKPLLDIVDTKNGFINIGLELSFLNQDEQNIVNKYFFEEEKNKKLSVELAKKIKEKSKKIAITRDILNSLTMEGSKDKSKSEKSKPNIKIEFDEIEEISGRAFNDEEQAKEFVMNCVRFYEENN